MSMNVPTPSLVLCLFFWRGDVQVHAQALDAILDNEYFIKRIDEYMATLTLQS